MATINAANIVTAVAGTILQGAGVGVAPAYSTATYPSTIAASSILYGSATNVVSELTTTANRIMATGTGGVPVWSTSVASDYSFTTSGSGVTRILSLVHGSNTASSNVTFQATVAGGSGGDPATKYTVSGVADWSVGLDNSDSDAFVISSGTALGTNNVFRAASNGDITVTSIANGAWNGTAIAETKGGTGQTSYTTGDTLYASAANTLSKLAIGSSGNVLTVSGGVPTWAAPSSGTSVTGYLQTLNTGASPADATTYYIAQGVTLTTITSLTGLSNGKFYVAAPFTLNSVYGVFIVNGTLASAQNTTVFVRVNDTTNTNVTTTASMSSAVNAFNGTGLGISLAAGDFFSFGITTPTWTTNPTTVLCSLGFSS